MDGTLVEGQTVSFASFGIPTLGSSLDWMEIVSDTRAYYLDIPTSQLVVWNPETMEVIGAIELTVDSPPADLVPARLPDRWLTLRKAVFLTAYGQHALRAFEVKALDYLMKPADPARLDRALTKALRPSAPVAVTPTDRLSKQDLVSLQDVKSLKFCRVSHIVYIQAANYYSEVHLASGKVAMVSQSLRRRAARLPDSFVRVHRSTIVNLDRVDELQQVEGGWCVYLQDRESPLPVSRRFAQALKARLQRST
ncbi:MAG: LytTR family DNA-binding domain-containing protein [Myxococcota bacterium]